jgi:tape measure domain-containing protein
MDAILRQTKDPANSLQQTLRHLNQAFKDGELGSQQFADAVAKAELKAKKQNDTLDKLRSEYEQMLVQSRQAAEAARQEARAKDELARANAKIIRDATNRERGLNEKAKIDQERQSVEAHRKALQQRLAVFKKEKAEREALADAAKKQAAAEAQANRNQGVEFLRQFETAQQATNRQIAEANKLHKQGAITAREHAAALQGIRRANSAMVQGFQQTKVAVATLLGPLVLVTQAYEGLKASIRLSADLDAAKAKFEVFTGSAEEAEKQLEQIRDLSSSSPVSFPGGQRAVATMLQFGVASDVVIASLRQIAEITAGDTQRMESLALAFAQSQAAGRLMGQELLQMVNAGFNPLKVISEQTGRSLVDLKKDMENGAISSEMVAKAFRDATAEGGRFNGLLDKVADTSFGQIVKATNELEKFGTAFGEMIEPATVALLREATDELKSMVSLIGEFRQISPDAGEFSEFLKLASTARDAAVVSFSDYERIYDGLKRTFDFLEGRPLSTDERLGQLRNEVRLFGTGQEELAKLEEQIDKASISFGEFLDLRDKYLAQAQELDLNAAPQRDINQLFLDFREEAGDSFFTDEQIAKFDRVKADMEKLNADRERLVAAFVDAARDARDRVLDARYQDDSENIRLLLAQADTAEKKTLTSLIRQGVSYETILATVSEATRKELERLNAIQAEADALEAEATAREEKERAEQEAAKQAAKDAEDKKKAFEDQVKSLENQIAYQRDLRDLVKEEAEIRRLMREDELTRLQAEEIRRKEKELEAFERTDNTPSVSSAPRAIQAGSQAAFAAVADRQAKMVQEQIKLQKEQLRAAKTLDAKAGAQVTILNDIREKPGVLPA